MSSVITYKRTAKGVEVSILSAAGKVLGKGSAPTMYEATKRALAAAKGSQ